MREVTDFDIENVLKQMTLEEKAKLCSGYGNFHTNSVQRLGIERMLFLDGPVGIRKEKYPEKKHLDGPPESCEATCLPSSTALAASFDTELARRYGELLGDECKALGGSVLLAPGVNIKRNPLCGRNFEYYSEDPHLTSLMAAEYIRGVQHSGVGACIKHFACNNQETRRLTSNSVVSERALREIYFPAFEYAVKEAKPYAVMSSYNLLNGTYTSQSKELLTDVLRKEWGFDGLVMSDWGAVDDRVKGLESGLDLEMPSSCGIRDGLIADAVSQGRLSEAVLDEAVRRLLKLYSRTYSAQSTEIDFTSHHAAAREIAAECFVLLKNEGDLLPIKAGKSVAVVGALAKQPRIQGAGSSKINPLITDDVLACLKEELGEVRYFEGYSLTGANDAELEAECLREIASYDCVVMFAGLLESDESEGYDRSDFNIPASQTALMEKICKLNKNLAVVLVNGGIAGLDFEDNCSAILEVFLAGQGMGKAVALTLSGKSVPSGRMPESVPKRLCDNPSHASFAGSFKDVLYGEDIFVGYRHYDLCGVKTARPFGFGLSYTEFEYSDLTAELCNGKVKVSVKVENTGDFDAKEAVLVFVGKKDSAITRPLKELRAFEKLHIPKGQTAEAQFELSERAFSHYDPDEGRFLAEGGTYEIYVCKDAETVLLSAEVSYPATKRGKLKLNRNMTIARALKYENGAEAVARLVEMFQRKSGFDFDPLKVKNPMSREVILHHPLRALIYSYYGGVTDGDLDSFIEEYNGRSIHE